MNITEKIMAKAAGLDHVEAGQIIDVSVDRAFTHEKLGPLFFDKFRDMGLKVWDKDRAIVFADHGVPPSRVLDANMILDTVKFGEEQGITCYNGERI